MSQKKRGLGKGLSDLGLNELLGDLNTTTLPTNEEADNYQFIELPLDQLQPGRYQPRQQIDADELAELSDSIKAQGIIQPIIVRRTNDKYEIIAGERRWRAARLAGLTRVPVVVRDIHDEAAMAVSLIENIQRKDLNAIEEAMALQRLLNEFNLTQQEIATAVGKSRTAVTNLLRLLKLNPEVKQMLKDGLLEMGHARTLLSLEDEQQLLIAKQVVDKKLSVRETENLIRKLSSNSTNNTAKTTIDPDIKMLQEKIADKLAAKVAIQHKQNGKGKLVIHYHSVEELDGILSRFE
jgi:ParB family transcriptional regulator, chromosome partitioning protein